MSELSRIPREVLRYNLLPGLKEEDIKAYLKVSPSIAEHAKGYTEDPLYSKKRIELNYNKGILLKPEYGEYNINWINVYNLFQDYESELMGRLSGDLSIGEVTDEYIQEYIEENIWYALLNPDEDNPEYINMAKYMNIPLNHDDSIAVINAAENGHINILNKLLEEKDINPGNRGNDAISFAIMNNHSDIVYRLLEEDRVDPSFNNNAVLGYAAEYGNLHVFEHLMEDSRVIAVGINGDLGNYKSLIESAVLGGNLDIINYIINDSEYLDNNFDSINDIIFLAIANNNVNLIKILLNSNALVKKIEVFEMLQSIVNNGNLELLQYIIERFNIDEKYIKISKILNTALSENHLNIVNYLLDNIKYDKFEATKIILEVTRIDEWTSKKKYIITKLLKQFDPDSIIKELLGKNILHKFLMGYYGVKVDGLDVNSRSNLYEYYLIMLESKKIIDNYINNSNTDVAKEYKVTRELLGELLDKSANKRIFSAFRYLIELGSPITYNEGLTFSRGVLLWGPKALQLINKERLTYYMSNRDLASNLVSAIIKHLPYIEGIEKIKYSNGDIDIIIEMLDYLFNNTGIEIDVTALKEEYKNVRKLINYINGKVKHTMR